MKMVQRSTLEVSVFRLLIKKLRDGERGFTMIELMVVVLIIAILIAIAIPTFLGVRGRAQNRAAQSNLRNEITAAKAIFADGDRYGVDQLGLVNDLIAAEPSLAAQDGASGSPKEIQVLRVDDTTVCMQVRSDSGNFYGMRATETTGGGQFFSGPASVGLTGATCGISRSAF